MHLEQEITTPGRVKYRVYTAQGALIYIGESANVAQELYEIGEQEEIDAKLARKAGSGRSSDRDS